jgi:mannosyltransferase
MRRLVAWFGGSLVISPGDQPRHNLDDSLHQALSATTAPPLGQIETGLPPNPSLLARLAQRPALLAVPLLALLAFVLRFQGYDRLSLWQDEGWTVSYARLPWPEVLGLRGQYDAHPPLYFAAAKLAATVIPEAVAGRLVSVAAGTLTVVVLYAVAARLAGHLAAACAGLLLAVAPLHVWYSQEARMYALSALLVALSYLALVAFARGGSPWWAALYGVAVLLAMYVDYSAAYPLIPQGLLLLLLPRWYGRRILLLWLAALAGAAVFLPWVPQLLASLPEHATGTSA